MESISLQCPVTIKVKFNEKVGDKMPDNMNKQIIVEDEKIIEIRN